MAAIPLKLWQGTAGPVGGTPVPLYTVPAGKYTILRSIILTNTTGTDATVTIAILGEYADPALPVHRIISNYTIKASDTVVIDMANAIMAAGDALAAAQQTLNAINLYASGVMMP